NHARPLNRRASRINVRPVIHARLGRPARPLSFVIVSVSLTAALGSAGCQSDCRSKCPPTEVVVVASPGENLGIMTGTWNGPACRQTVQYCEPDSVNACVRFRIVGFAEGTCDVALTFDDGRPAMTVHAEFGPAPTQGCCRGHPVVGPSIITIPPLPTDAGTDAPPAVDAADDDAGAEAAAAGDDAASDGD